MQSVVNSKIVGVCLMALASVLFLTACPMQDPSSATPLLPRFTKLDAFDPHRKDYVCKHEADVNPPITEEAEALFQQGMAATSNDLWPADRNYKKAAALWQQAADHGHWKAQFNLAGLYLKGQGVPQDIDKALELTEDLMRKGVPAAWDSMGAYYMGGVGPLKQDATVAYAFWQKAADMGSMAAQAYLGEKLLGTHDDPPSFWGNRVVGLNMLECGYVQGSGKAAYELGLTLDNTDRQHARALRILHEGVKLGSEDSAGYLFASFDSGDALVENRIDKARAERYQVLANSLWRNPDLRFPNLDKVLPLPPAPLPKWDGDKQTLIDAAKALVPKPVVPPTPGSQRTGRAHIPDGWVLPRHPVLASSEAMGYDPHTGVPAQYESTVARFSGYWIAQLLEERDARAVAWNRVQVPQHYEQHEAFDSDRAAMGLSRYDGRIMWHYLGVAFKCAEAEINPLVTQGIARTTRIPEPQQRCTGDALCPKTGVWFGSVSKEHPQASSFNRWDRQLYLEAGQAFPDPRLLQLSIEPAEITWLWLGNANVPGFAGVLDVTLSDLHDDQRGLET